MGEIQDSRSVERLRTAAGGPLAPYVEGWRRELSARGYAPHSIIAHSQLVAHLNGWLVATNRDGAAVTNEVIEEYLRARRTAGYRNHTTVRALAPLVGYLRDLQVVPLPADPPPATPMEALIVEFGDYLANERGLAPGSVHHHRRFARLFLTELGLTEAAGLDGLTAADVTSFAVSQAQRRSPGDMRVFVSAVRSLLRFLHLTGRVAVPLAAAVPSVPGWRFGSLPRGVQAGQVAAVLASCDRASAVGRRDYAILMLLSRLGLRASEVIGITLDDVDWRAGELRVVGKASHVEKLPLPADVGAAMADYLRHGRARTSCRHLFITVRAPFTKLALNTSISWIVTRACRRAGIEPFGPHRLRHAVACDLLTEGASLAEIGQLLRHRTERATAIYAKADVEALRSLARPCPPGSLS
jgi:site-specific recombinase XerD